MSNVISREQKTRNGFKFGDWVVSKSGDMDYKSGTYIISEDTLYQSNWILHMSEKTWINMNDFIPAYLQAMKNAGLQYNVTKFYY
jgi:hypothetical protein